MGLDDSFEELKTESTESVFMGNHNFSDISFDCFVQKGDKSFSLKVEARSNILDNRVTRVSKSEELSLPFQVFFLEYISGISCFSSFNCF